MKKEAKEDRSLKGYAIPNIYTVRLHYSHRPHQSIFGLFGQNWKYYQYFIRLFHDKGHTLQQSDTSRTSGPSWTNLPHRGGGGIDKDPDGQEDWMRVILTRFVDKNILVSCI